MSTVSNKYMEMMAFLEKLSIHCPQCDSTQITTCNNEWPLKQRCLDCGHRWEQSKEE